MFRSNAVSESLSTKRHIKSKLYSVFNKTANYEERGWFLRVSISHEWIKINKKNLENSFKYNKLHFYQPFNGNYSILFKIIYNNFKNKCLFHLFQDEKFWLIIIKMFKYIRPNFFLFGTLNLSWKLIYNPVKLLWLGFFWKWLIAKSRYSPSQHFVAFNRRSCPSMFKIRYFP